jgi:hypothetical protein
MTKRNAVTGTRTVLLHVRLWTNGIDGRHGICPGHARDDGVVDVQSNPLHGIKSLPQAVPFKGLADLVPALVEALARAGVELHASPSSRRIYRGDFPRAKRRAR